MARRLGAQMPRRTPGSADVELSEPGAVHSKSHSSPYLTFCLLLTGVVIIVFYIFGNINSVFHQHGKKDVEDVRQSNFVVKEGSDPSFGTSDSVLNHEKLEEADDNFDEFLASKDGDRSSRPECRAAVCNIIPALQEVYGKTMQRVLHVGPGTCGIVSKLLKEENTEVWGIQPFEMKPPVHGLCDNFLRKGIIRVADPFRPLPYRSRSFSLVLVTDTLDHIKSSLLNQTLPEFARLSSHGLVIVADKRGGYLTQNSSLQSGKILKTLKPRSRLWWQRRFEAVGLKEDEERTKSFDNLMESTKKINANIFHIVL